METLELYPHLSHLPDNDAETIEETYLYKQYPDLLDAIELKLMIILSNTSSIIVNMVIENNVALVIQIIIPNQTIGHKEYRIILNSQENEIYSFCDGAFNKTIHQSDASNIIETIISLMESTILNTR